MMLLAITKGAGQMLHTDPHGWTLTLVSVSVVFLALVILYYLYTFIGKLNSGEIRMPSPGKKDRSPEVAAVIAMALDAELGGDDGTAAAIATALHLYMNDGVHDVEPGIITIRRTDSHWKDKALLFRTAPDRTRP